MWSTLGGKAAHRNLHTSFSSVCFVDVFTSADFIVYVHCCLLVSIVVLLFRLVLLPVWSLKHLGCLPIGNINMYCKYICHPSSPIGCPSWSTLPAPVCTEAHASIQHLFLDMENLQGGICMCVWKSQSRISYYYYNTADNCSAGAEVTSEKALCTTVEQWTSENLKGRERQ